MCESMVFVLVVCVFVVYVFSRCVFSWCVCSRGVCIEATVELTIIIVKNQLCSGCTNIFSPLLDLYLLHICLNYTLDIV